VGRERKIAAIELKVDAPQQLFHDLDPSPLARRDLDEAVDSYIIESARELRASRYELLLHVHDGDLPPERRKALAESIRAYFAYRQDMENRKLRRLLAEGAANPGHRTGLPVRLRVVGRVGLRRAAGPVGPFLNQGGADHRRGSQLAPG